MISLPKELPAGFQKGDIVGVVQLSLNGAALLEVPIVTKVGVEQRTFLTGIRRGIESWLLISD